MHAAGGSEARNEQGVASCMWPAGRVQSVEFGDQRIKLGMGCAERNRTFEELFAHYGKELCFILGGIRVQERVRAAIDLLRKAIELPAQIERPVFERATRSRFGFGQPNSLVVEVMGEFVEHDVVARVMGGAGRDHVLPGQDDPARIPGLTREHTPLPRDQTGLVFVFLLYPERRRIDEDRLQRWIQIGWPAEPQPAGVRGDRDPHLIGDREPVATDEGLFGYERCYEAVETIPGGHGPRRPRPAGPPRGRPTPDG